jgi:hypothetical protein
MINIGVQSISYMISLSGVVSKIIVTKMTVIFNKESHKEYMKKLL